VLDAQLLAAFVLGADRVYVLTHPERGLSPEQERRFEGLVERRGRHEPVAYILGTCEFMSLGFAVSADVLIPRADTECLAEAAIAHIRGTGARRVLEIGTGSGCVAVSLAVSCPDVLVTAVDISPAALDVARRNADVHGVGKRITFVLGDIFRDSTCAALAATGRADILVSNPPYITAEEMAGLPASVGGFEPHMALAGGADGLDFYREITRRAPELTGEGAAVFYETGCRQGVSVCEILRKRGFTDVRILPDLTGRDRVVHATRG